MKSIVSNKFKYPSCCAVAVVGLAYFIYKSSILTKYITRLKYKWFKIKTPYIVSSNEECIEAVHVLKRKLQLSDNKVLGLDCEWVSNSSRRPVALLQLSTPDGFCSIFRLFAMQNFPDEFVTLLEDRNVMKVGVAVNTDARYLLSDYGVHCEGCLDLRFLASQAGVTSRGLANLAKELFGIELNKDWQIRCSNWEADVLSNTQVQYAALDACIAVDIFNELNNKEICRKFSLLKRLLWSKKDYWNYTLSLWTPYIGQNFINPKEGNKKYHSRSKFKEPLIRKHSTMALQRRHYTNIYLLAPDEQVLCAISEKKAAWYTQRNLADIVCEDPKTLRLKFEPVQRSKGSDGYYAQPKENICVVCGSEKDLRRKNIVPLEYRKYFVESLKKHHSHDVLLMCLQCHARSNSADAGLRNQLVVEFDAPLTSGNNKKFHQVPELLQLRNAARAIFFNGDVLPTERKKELQNLICDKLGVARELLTQKYLESFIDVDCQVESETYVSHGMKVVQSYVAGEGAEALKRRWRQHFLDTMSPQYLPALWTVNFVLD